MMTLTKYKSANRNFGPKHLVVFSNHYPDVSKMSGDRWDIREIRGKTMYKRDWQEFKVVEPESDGETIPSDPIDILTPEEEGVEFPQRPDRVVVNTPRKRIKIDDDKQGTKCEPFDSDESLWD